MGRKTTRKGARGSVDWVTATTTDRRRGMNWCEMFNSYRAREDRVTPVKTHGFTGMGLDKLRYLYREDDERFMMVAQGEVAAKLWADLVTAPAKVTRVDLAVDVEMDPGLKNAPFHIFRILSKVDQRSKLTVVMDKAGGTTLYTGSRQSDMFGRMYDKGAQSETRQPGELYRYELEAKGKVAKTLGKELDGMTGEQDKVPVWIAENVKGFFGKRLIPVAFETDKEKADWQTSYCRVTSADKRLAWIQSQVKPSVQWLFEIGLGRQCMEALGLNIKLVETKPGV